MCAVTEFHLLGVRNRSTYNGESKPGAAAVATYLAHKVIGLDGTGYGGILGEGLFTCRRVPSPEIISCLVLS